MNNPHTVLSVNDLSVDFAVKKSVVHAVKGIGFCLEKKSRTALLGETGCGKSVTAAAVLRLLPENARVKGTIRLNDYPDIMRLSPGQMKRLRGKTVVYLPQNAVACLNPVYTAGFFLRETIRRSCGQNGASLKKTALSLLEKTGLDDPEKVYGMYPSQLSGGMARRVVLAAGLSTDPCLVIADEPTKGLDAEAREKYLMLTKNLYDSAAFWMITHDIHSAASCGACMVMHGGRIVEEGPAQRVLNAPLHPYTKGLLASHPAKGLKPISGRDPGMEESGMGCVFFGRCEKKTGECAEKAPDVRERNGVKVWCRYA
jgi:peptide/nickel transport system ATP-binding protein